MTTEFQSMPKDEELIAASDKIDPIMAQQMLFLVKSMSQDPAKQVTLLNKLTHALESGKIGDRDDIRWVTLVGWIGSVQQAISGEIRKEIDIFDKD